MKESKLSHAFSRLTIDLGSLISFSAPSCSGVSKLCYVLKVWCTAECWAGMTPIGE